MSTPTHRHTLLREIERGAGGEYVPARFAQMRCDGAMGNCRLPPERAPRLIVPPKAGFLIAGALSPRAAVKAMAAFGAPKPLRMMTTLHYCAAHQAEVTLDGLMPDKVKADFERVAKAKWSHDFTPDFDKAFIDWVLVTTPEYLAFLNTIEIGRPALGGIPLL